MPIFILALAIEAAIVLQRLVLATLQAILQRTVILVLVLTHNHIATLVIGLQAPSLQLAVSIHPPLPLGLDLHLDVLELVLNVHAFVQGLRACGRALLLGFESTLFVLKGVERSHIVQLLVIEIDYILANDCTFRFVVLEHTSFMIGFVKQVYGVRNQLRFSEVRIRLEIASDEVVIQAARW